ncbi:hypothetical protein AB1Y20_020044 [Prymnesium parvum]|uniref:Uncharacterized protein n=1 Tax=Prymnesium parvum TaxID=97485 RepID=A0AB34JXM1_PRYPA
MMAVAAEGSTAEGLAAEGHAATMEVVAEGSVAAKAMLEVVAEGSVAVKGLTVEGYAAMMAVVAEGSVAVKGLAAEEYEAMPAVEAMMAVAAEGIVAAKGLAVVENRAEVQMVVQALLDEAIATVVAVFVVRAPVGVGYLEAVAEMNRMGLQATEMEESKMKLLVFVSVIQTSQRMVTVQSTVIGHISLRST